MRKTTQLRELLRSTKLEFLVEAHNGISARIVQEAGFAGIWASSLSMSAQLGVRDSDEASWTQVLEVVEFMADATSIPILLDAGTGYGNFNAVRRAVKKMEQRGIAGICIEDKQVKINSLLTHARHPLVSIDEFCGKIAAARDACSDDHFVVIARVESLIAGHSVAEALRRAEAYQQAGADGILIHSNQSSASQVLAFKAAWTAPCPVVIAPTTYSTTPTSVFREHGFSVVIWANHLLRASICALQQAAALLKQEESVLGLQDRLVPVTEVFRLQDMAELREAEQQYLPRLDDLGIGQQA